MKQFLIIALLLSVFSTTAQDSNALMNQQINGATANGANNNWLYVHNDIPTKGTPLLFTEWSRGWLVYQGKKYDSIPLKFNVYQNELMFKTPKGDSLLVIKGQVPTFGFYLPTQTMYFKAYKVPTGKTVQEAYCEVIYEGNKLAFIKKHTKVFSKAGKAEAYAEPPANRYTDETTFYIVKNQEWIEVSRKKKALLKTFAEKKELLEKFWETEKLDIDKDTDLKKFFEYYESLL